VEEFYCLLSTADHHTLFWEWEENENKLSSQAHSEAAQRISGIA
jgi:hypothetical protein